MLVVRKMLMVMKKKLTLSLLLSEIQGRLPVVADRMSWITKKSLGELVLRRRSKSLSKRCVKQSVILRLMSSMRSLTIWLRGRSIEMKVPLGMNLSDDRVFHGRRSLRHSCPKKPDRPPRDSRIVRAFGR